MTVYVDAGAGDGATVTTEVSPSVYVAGTPFVGARITVTTDCCVTMLPDPVTTGPSGESETVTTCVTVVVTGGYTRPADVGVNVTGRVWLNVPIELGKIVTTIVANIWTVKS